LEPAKANLEARRSTGGVLSRYVSGVVQAADALLVSEDALDATPNRPSREIPASVEHTGVLAADPSGSPIRAVKRVSRQPTQNAGVDATIAWRRCC
jgi:hypothetical protein